jgi:hypothetical protein
MSSKQEQVSVNFKTIQSVIETEIQSLIERYNSILSSKYDIQPEELVQVWNEMSSNVTIKTTVSKTSKSTNVQPKTVETKTGDDGPVSSVVSNLLNTDFNAEIMMKSTVAELKAICKQRNLKVSGTKNDLIARLMGKEEPSPKNKPESKSSESKPKTETKTAKVEKAQAKVLETPVAKKLTANIPQVLITRNSFGRYEHAETGLVFDSASRVVIGKQLPDGTVDHLTEDDIDMCNAFKFPYELPTNLDHKAKLNDVVVKELEEDEELDADDVEEEQLLEEEEEEEYEEIEEEEEIEYEG